MRLKTSKIVSCGVKFKNGGQASQNRTAREVPHPGLSRWKPVSALPSHATPNCSPSGLVPVEAGFCTTLARHSELPPTGLVPVEARFADWRMAIRGQTGVPLGQAPKERCFRVRVVMQKLAPHRHEAGGGNTIPHRQPPIQNWTHRRGLFHVPKTSGLLCVKPGRLPSREPAKKPNEAPHYYPRGEFVGVLSQSC